MTYAPFGEMLRECIGASVTNATLPTTLQDLRSTMRIDDVYFPNEPLAGSKKPHASLSASPCVSERKNATHVRIAADVSENTFGATSAADVANRRSRVLNKRSVLGEPANAMYCKS